MLSTTTFLGPVRRALQQALGRCTEARITVANLFLEALLFRANRVLTQIFTRVNWNIFCGFQQSGTKLVLSTTTFLGPVRRALQQALGRCAEACITGANLFVGPLLIRAKGAFIQIFTRINWNVILTYQKWYYFGAFHNDLLGFCETCAPATAQTMHRSTQNRC